MTITSVENNYKSIMPIDKLSTFGEDTNNKNKLQYLSNIPHDSNPLSSLHLTNLIRLSVYVTLPMLLLIFNIHLLIIWLLLHTIPVHVHLFLFHLSIMTIFNFLILELINGAEYFVITQLSLSL